MSFFGGASTTTAPALIGPVDKDVELVDPPPDSISSIAFSPAADYLAVGSWDNNVSVAGLFCLCCMMGRIELKSSCLALGSAVRSRREWTVAGEGHVLA